MVGQLELALEETQTGKAERAGLTEITQAEEAPGKPVANPCRIICPATPWFMRLSSHAARTAAAISSRSGRGCLGKCSAEPRPPAFGSFAMSRREAGLRPLRHHLQAPAASRPIGRGMAGPIASACAGGQILRSPAADRAEWHLMPGKALILERSTLADWVGQCSALLRPLVERLGQHVLTGEKLHAEDTPVPVLAPGDGKTKTGGCGPMSEMIGRPETKHHPPFGSPTPPTRKGRKHPQTHLKSFRGILQADAFAGFDTLYATGDILEAACWAHARRKFFEIHQAQGSPIAAEALKRIAALYAIESTVRGQPTDSRLKGREQAKPILDEFDVWLLDTRRQLSKKSGLADAIGYALNHWQALIRYASDGRIEIDNNAAERALRAVALGRKNFLFAGLDAGGDRAAAIYSLVGSAKLNGLAPEAYLRFVIERIADYRISELDDLLPWMSQRRSPRPLNSLLPPDSD